MTDGALTPSFTTRLIRATVSVGVAVGVFLTVLIGWEHVGLDPRYAVVAFGFVLAMWTMTAINRYMGWDE